MSDFINREEVLKKLNYEMKYGAVIDQCGLETAYDIVENLSSIKIDRNRNFLEIIVEYPKICIYPEYEGKPYYSIKYEEKGETIVGFGTYKPEVLSQYLREYFISSAEPERTAKVINVDEINVYCGNCDTPLSDWWTYCPSCGARLEWE